MSNRTAPNYGVRTYGYFSMWRYTLFWSIEVFFFVPFFLIFWAIVVTVFTHHFLSWNIMQIYLDIHWTWRNEYTFCYLWGHWMVFNLLDGILHLKCATEVLGFKRFRVVITTLWEYELQLSIFFFFASQETRNGYTDVCSEYLENLNCLLWNVKQSLRVWLNGLRCGEGKYLGRKTG